MKKNIFIKMIIIVLLAIIVNLFTSNKAYINAKSKNKENLEEKIKKYNINDTVECDNLEVTVLDKTVSSQLGDQNIAQITANGNFVILTVKIKNNSNKPIIIGSEMFNLQNENLIYHVSSEADILLQNYSQSMLLKEINPNNILVGKLVFDISGSHAFSNNNVLNLKYNNKSKFILLK